jgi:parvulin-like peptidyl-prolyl isomerase
MKAQSISKILIMTACAAAFAQPPQPPQTPPPVRIQPGTPIPGGPQTPAPTVDVPADTVVLSIGNVKLTRAQFEQWVATLPDNLKGALSGPQKRKVVEQYAELTSLAQEARKRKLDQKPMVAIQIDQALAQALVQEVSANLKPSEAEMKTYYDQHKSESEFEQAKARHILIGVKPAGAAPAPTPGKKELTDAEALAKAKDIREKLVKGGDFAALAKSDSDDPGSKDTGGEYTVSHNQMVKEFDAAVWSLPIGQVSEPVKTQFGYHIIQVQSRGMKTYEEAKPQIEAKMKPDMQKKAVEDAKKQVPVTISDDYFGKQ